MTGYVGRGSGIAGRVLACLDSFVSFSHQGENESLAGEAEVNLKGKY